MATDELANKLNRRINISDAIEAGDTPPPCANKVFNPYTEFKEFSRKQIKDLEKTFKKYDTGHDNFIDFEELKHMMEKLGAPQTHLALKDMIKEVDEDEDNKINFREFLLIFRKAAKEELNTDSGLYELYQNVWEIDVDKEGVKGAKNFFEAKIDAQTREMKFENEIKEEQEEKKKLAEEARERKKAFKEKIWERPEVTESWTALEDRCDKKKKIQHKTQRMNSKIDTFWAVCRMPILYSQTLNC